MQLNQTKRAHEASPYSKAPKPRTTQTSRRALAPSGTAESEAARTESSSETSESGSKAPAGSKSDGGESSDDGGSGRPGDDDDDEDEDEPRGGRGFARRKSDAPEGAPRPGMLPEHVPDYGIEPA